MKGDEATFPPTTERVPGHTADHINRQIRRRTESTVAYFAEHPEEIDQRLDELDREWDIERTLEANAASITLAGLALSRLHTRRWLALPTVVAAFLLQHALQGWCPPVPVFRRLGVRTASEIAQERYALRYMRGDFKNAPQAKGSAAERARQAIEAAAG